MEGSHPVDGDQPTIDLAQQSFQRRRKINNRYTIEELLGAGAFGPSIQGAGRDARRTVALKTLVLDDGHSDGDEAVTESSCTAVNMVDLEVSGGEKDKRIKRHALRMGAFCAGRPTG
jgi:hypothetical protein